MAAFLPGEIVGIYVTPQDTRLRRIGLITECQTGAIHRNMRTKQAQTVGALLGGGKLVLIAPESQRIAKFIDYRGSETANQRKYAGIRPINIAHPGGRELAGT